jgi:Outer membrane protein beta-barrel domain
MRQVFTLFFLAFASLSKAQDTDTAAKKLDVFSTIGVSFVDKDYEPASGNSIQTTTGLELRLSRPSSLGISLSFDSYGYEKSGPAYKLDGSLRATALGLFYRYKFGSNTWQPYLKAGGGTAWLSLPTVSVEQGTTNIEKKVQNVGFALAEAGFQVRVLPRYSLLIGAEKKWLGKSSLADNTSLGTTSFRIGLISSF